MNQGEIGRTYIAGSRQYECTQAYNRGLSTKCYGCDCKENVLDCLDMPECVGVIFKIKENQDENQN